MLEKTIGLTTTKSTTNMNLFTEKHKLKKYETVYEIIDDFMKVRLKGYIARKAHQIKKLEKECKLITNKARFIVEQCDDIIDLRRKKKEQVIDILKTRNYDVMDNDKEYKYLRTMRIEQVEMENVEKLLKEKGDKQTELNVLRETKITTIWKKEISELVKHFKKYQTARRLRQLGRNKD